MKAFLLFFLLLAPAMANTLSLEFAQQGEPKIPRALIVIHNAFESRDDFKSFFQLWADRSWARDQYCSVYCYEYTQNGLSTLATPEELAKDLYSRIQSSNFATGEPDSINEARRSKPTDERQPVPTLKGDNLELMFAGNGYGGLIARETALLAKKNGIKVTRVGYFGTPLDGLSTIDLVLGFTIKERAQSLGLSQALSIDQLASLSPAWWHLAELFDSYKDWANYFQDAYKDVVHVAAYGAAAAPVHPTDNVLYGRYRQVKRNQEAGDGFLPQPVTWGTVNGPGAFLSKTALAGTDHAHLTEKSGEVVLKNLLDKEMLYAYLARRQGIEELIGGKGDVEPLGTYWDERDAGRWRYAYASPKDLYEMMWGVGQ